jgi:hypothetical protein
MVSLPSFSTMCMKNELCVDVCCWLREPKPPRLFVFGVLITIWLCSQDVWCSQATNNMRNEHGATGGMGRHMNENSLKERAFR